MIRTALALAAALAGPPAAAAAEQDGPLRMRVIDAEGGAATLYVTPDGQSLLVDTGWPASHTRNRDGFPQVPTADLIVQAAADLGLERIDYVLVTHYHLDHVGGFADIARRIPIGAVIDHGPNREAAQQTPPPPSSAPALFDGYQAAAAGVSRRSVSVGDTLQIGPLTLTFVVGDGAVIDAPLPGAGGAPTGCDEAIDPDRIGGEENRRSLGFVARYGQTRILDLADATRDVEHALVCPENRIGAVDLMMVSHHGSELSNSAALLSAAHPRVAVVANGPRKGGDASVLSGLAQAASQPAVWQMHFAERAPQANRPLDFIANPAAHAQGGLSLEIEVEADGEIRVVNARNGFSRRYPPR